MRARHKVLSTELCVDRVVPDERQLARADRPRLGVKIGVFGNSCSQTWSQVFYDPIQYADLSSN